MKAIILSSALFVLFAVFSQSETASIVCYFSSWATYRTGDGKFDVEDIDPSMCTHLIYAFAGINNETYRIQSLDPYNDLSANGGLNAYGRFVNLKYQNPGLKVILAVGGYTQESAVFSQMASKALLRKRFAYSVVEMLLAYKFDGLDVDWEYPANLGGQPEDKENFVLFLQDLREELVKYNLMLTVAVSMGYDKIETGYDIPSVAAQVDHIHMMAYDFHGSWENLTDVHSPLYARPNEKGDDMFYNVNTSVHIWIDGGAPPEKLVLGIGSYGQTFDVQNCLGEIGEVSLNPGSAGPYTGQAGMLGYNEICESLMEDDSPLHRDRYTVMPWTCLDTTWVSFDDTISTRTKSIWGKLLGLKGSLVWSIDTDDFKGTCGDRFPLLKKINQVWKHFDGTSTTTVHSVTTEPINLKVLCYFSSWAFYRSDKGKFQTSNVDPSLCTHIIYCSAALDNETYAVVLGDKNVDIIHEGIANITSFKTDFPDLKVMISVGGASQDFSMMASEESSRSAFVQSAVEFIQEYDFDGLEIMWQYPANNGGEAYDKQNFAQLITEMREEFDKNSFLLSSGTGVSQSILTSAYDMKTMGKKLDFISLMTFDYHGSWEEELWHHSPLHPRPGDEDNELYYINAELTVQTWLEGGTPSHKLILGYGMYGRSFTTDEDSSGELGSAATGPGSPGAYTNQEGFLGFYEICPNLNVWETESDEYVAAPWSFGSGEWVGYDDITSIKDKTKWAINQGLGGGLAYTIDTDDFNDLCGMGKFPLLKTLYNEWLSQPSTATTETEKNKPSPTTENIGEEKDYKLVCYYSSWAQYRTGEGKLYADEIDPFVCTHLIYAFVGLNNETFDSVQVLDSWGDIDKEGFAKFVSLRDMNPNLKVLIAIGGSTQNSSMYSIMAADPDKRSSFVDSVVSFMTEYDFNGFDFVWEFPGNEYGSPEDKKNFVTLLQELREVFDEKGWILSAAVGMRKEIVELAYDIPSLSAVLDFISMMTFDFHDYRDGQTGHHSQLYAMPEEEGDDAFLNVNASVHLWLEGGADPNKLVLGIPAYAKTFEISGDSGDLGTNSSEPGEEGPITQTKGFLGYNELCEEMLESGWTVDTNEYVVSPWTYSDSFWGGYDDSQSIFEKTQWAKSLGIKGGMIWSIETDDFGGYCSDQPYSLINNFREALETSTTSPPTTMKTTVTTPKQSTNHETTLEQTTKHDTTPEKTAKHDTTPEKTTSHDTTAEKTTSHDTTAEKTTSHDTTAEKTTSHDTTPEKTTKHDTTPEKTTKHDTTREQTAKHDTTREQTMKHDTTQKQTTKPDTTWEQTMKNDTTREQTAKPDTTQKQTTQEITTPNQPIEHKTTPKVTTPTNHPEETTEGSSTTINKLLMKQLFILILPIITYLLK